MTSSDSIERTNSSASAPPSPVSLLTSPSQRYDFLDGLRGLAILGVLSTHVGISLPELPGAFANLTIWGLRGVQLFFTVSALTLLLVTNSESFDPKRFYLRRLFRIAPMFYLATVLYVAWNWSGIPLGSGRVPTITDTSLTMLFLHGFNPSGINNVVPGGWSIANEAIFYALFPAILRASLTLSKSIAIAVGSFALAMASLLLKSRIPGLSGPEYSDFWHFNFAMNALPFAMGLLIFKLRQPLARIPAVVGWARPARMVAFTALLVYGCFADRMMLELPHALLIGVFVLATAIRPEGFITSRAMTFLGEISFSIYLIHFAVLYLVERCIPTLGIPLLDFAVRYIACLALSAMLASLTYRWIEQTGVAWGRRLTTLQKRPSAQDARSPEQPTAIPNSAPPGNRQ